tara:strand:- start:593 stop:814 length:222 start_codon:yes stop_codon:yes gene_type:complete
MSIYWCEPCGNFKDKMDDPCQEFPEGSNKLVCPDCMTDIEDENELLLKAEDDRKNTLGNEPWELIEESNNEPL